MCIAAASLSTGSAHAALISGDDLIHGVGSITIDTVNNLEWLDLTLSTSFSFNDAQAEFTGGLFDGFRHATRADIELLFAEAGVSLTTSAPNYTPVAALLTLVGIIQTFPTSIQSLGLYDDTLDGLNAVSIGYTLFVALQSPPFSIADFRPDTYLPTVSNPSLGNWLVRAASPTTPVPAPAGIFIFGPAVLLLGAMRKRTQVRRA
jgi:hypothetical protein